jgi:hypothetical protein
MSQRSWVSIAAIACASFVGCSAPGRDPGSTERVKSASQALSGNITLVSGDPASGGYDFDTQTYAGLTTGDFYFYQGAFWANNLGQRGVTEAGSCPSVDKVTTMPLTGYTRFGVNGKLGHCYVALTHNDERDYIVFRVDNMGATTVALSWKLVPTGDWGATLTSGDPATGGYDFDTRTYTGLTPGDLYFYQGAFWANNLGQRGVVLAGPCKSVDGVATVPMGGYTRFGVTATVGQCYVALGHNEEHGNVVFRVDDLTSTTVTITFKIVDDCYGLTASTYNQNVNCWLSQNSGVSQYVVWENRLALGMSSPVAWPQWPNARRDDLRVNLVAYEGLLAGTLTQDPDPLVDPPVNQQTLQDSDLALLVLSESDASRLYVKTVAMSLAVELSQYVPWSVTTYDAESLATLFDSRHTLTYTWSGAPANFGVNTPQAEGYMAITNNYDSDTHTTFSPYVSFVVPDPPAQALAFVQAKGLLGTTRLATIENTLDWTRRLHHFVGGPGLTTGVAVRIWGYRGPSPVSAMIATTTDPNFDPSNPYHFTAGCHGTAGFLQSILRTLNIPVDNSVHNGHSSTRFMTETLYLSHGDDPYIGNDIYGLKSSDQLISQATYNSWFVNNTLAAENIGRGNPDAKIRLLSTQLQFDYCLDPPNTPPANSFLLHAFQAFPDVYPLSYLENLPPDPANPSAPASLWDRLAQKIAAQGGCTATQNTINTEMTACFAVQPVAERLDCNW